MYMSKVLIAEDDKFLASAYRLKFEKTNFEVKLIPFNFRLLDIKKTLINQPHYLQKSIVNFYHSNV